jgi:glutathione S-transferase
MERASAARVGFYERSCATSRHAVMERHLTARSFFVDDRYSIADIALYAYTHVAPEGGFDLSPYPAVRGWLQRVAAEPRHLRITD